MTVVARRWAARRATVLDWHICPTPGGSGDGTGRVHDWSISRQIVEAAGRPVFLAGGLRPDNIAEAARRVDPFGFDVCTGIRTDGRLDAEKLRALLAQLPQLEGSDQVIPGT